MANLMLSVMGRFAEFERSLIKGAPARRHHAGSETRSLPQTQKTLSPEQAAELVRRAASGIPKSTLARDYGISRETVYQYLRQAAAATADRASPASAAASLRADSV
jgi:DNA invertase Pin-like site-specific DNA recombinase